MIITKTKAEMVEEWRIRKGLLLYPSGSVGRDDDESLTLLIEREIDKWYDDLFRNGPAEWLEITDIASSAAITVGQRGEVSVNFPQSLYRFISARMAGWSRPVTKLTDADSYQAILATSSFAGAGPQNPAAIFYPPSTLTLLRADKEPRIESLCVAIRPDSGLYTFDTAALSTLPIITL